MIVFSIFVNNMVLMDGGVTCAHYDMSNGGNNILLFSGSPGLIFKSSIFAKSVTVFRDMLWIGSTSSGSDDGWSIIMTKAGGGSGVFNPISTADPLLGSLASND